MSLACEWFVLAERVIRDADTNNLTLVNCVEQIGAPGFPSLHFGFAVAGRYRWTGEPPKKPTQVNHRVVRLAEGAEPEVVCELNGEWAPGTHIGRVWVNFHHLRLVKAETLRFRLDHQVGRKAWEEGPSCSVDVVLVEGATEAAHRADGAAASR